MRRQTDALEETKVSIGADVDFIDARAEDGKDKLGPLAGTAVSPAAIQRFGECFLLSPTIFPSLVYWYSIDNHQRQCRRVSHRSAPAIVEKPS